MHRPDAFSWTGLFEPTKAEFHQIRRHIDLHDLVVEDALNAHQRPKLEQYDDDLFVVLRTASYVEDDEVQFGELQIFVTKRAVLHVRHNSPSKLVGVRQALERLPDRLACGPGSVLHAIVDHVVDDYEPVVDGLEKDVREVERAVFTRVGGGNPVEQIYVLMRNVLTVQDALTPLLGPLHALATQPFEVIHEDLQEYFRDVHDHLAAVVQRVGTMHDLVTTILAANLTSVSVRQNEDMRKISRVGRDRGRPDDDRRDLRHELRPHARAPLDVGISVRDPAHGVRLRQPVPEVPQLGLALSGRGTAQ